jgi:hypothetical protein
MERSYNDRDFEKLLKDNANQYRMYPSEKVWKGVHSALHSRRKWYGVSALAILLIAGLGFSILYINEPGKLNSKITTPLSVTKIQEQTPVLLSEEKDPQVSNTAGQEIVRAEKNPLAVTSIPENDIVDQNNIGTLSVEQKPVFKIQPETLTEQSEIVENNNNEIQKIDRSSASIEIEKGNENFAAENIEGKINADDQLKTDISALASLNVPAIVSKKQPRLSAQLYFTPTISYRKLSENESPSSSGGYSFSQIVGVNNLVKHKPLMGLEFGMEGKYGLNDRFFLKSGFQFNINRYDISAYSHPTEIATVSVNNGFRTYNVAAPSNYGNFSGSKQNWVENFYFQVAIPMGAEYILTEKKKYSWGISGTIQPTYVIGDRAYLISSDFRNYAKFPDLMRRWNLSSGAETFISYTTGKIKWQTGPHVRYQHLSSFVSGYPVKENLFAIGLKVGATINYK